MDDFLPASLKLRDSPISLTARLFAHIARGTAIRRSRRKLIELEDYLLDDVGITRQQARREAGRPLWDVESHWLRSSTE